MLQENTLTSDALEHQSSPVRLVRPHFPKSGVGGFADNRTRKSRAYQSLNTSFVIFFSHCVLTPNSLNSTHIIHIKETSQDRQALTASKQFSRVPKRDQSFHCKYHGGSSLPSVFFTFSESVYKFPLVNGMWLRLIYLDSITCSQNILQAALLH